MTRKYPNTNRFALLMGVLFLLSMFMSSCSPEYYQNKYCPKTSVIKDSVIVHDTILKTEDRVLVLHDTVPCADFELNKDSNGVKIKVVVKNHYLTAKCDCEGQLIKFRFLEKHHFESHVRTISQKGKRCLPWWFWFGLGALSVVIVWQRKRIFGLLIKLIKPL